MKTHPESMPFYLHDNCALLSDAYAKLIDILKQEPSISERITILKTKSETLTIKYNDTLLHSVYDPERESLQFVHSQNIIEGSIVLVYGFGLGYHVQSILHAVGTTGKVFVLEPNLEILKAAFSLMDLQTVLNDPRFNLISGETEEIVALRFLSIIDRQLLHPDSQLDKIIIHSPSFKCLPEGFERRAPEVFEKINIKNIQVNIDTILKSPGLKNFRNIFHNVPAFFINAGPSLDDALPLLTHYQQKALLFCCDTALPALVDQGIMPDFVLTVDPQERSIEHFIHYFDCDTVLIFTPTSAGEVVRKYKGKKVVVLQKGHSITRRFEDLLAYKGFTHAGSSVSCIGLDVLMQMGCNPVLFIGMDYCFPGGKMYSSNITETKKWFSDVYKLNTIESIHREAINDKKVMTIKNKYGEEISTFQTLYAYLKQIESLISASENRQFYNFLSHGAHIEGSDDIFLCEELSLLLPKDIDKRICIEEEPVKDELRTNILSCLQNDDAQKVIS